MPNPTSPPQEQVDHVAEAERQLRTAEDGERLAQEIDSRGIVAQVHASLAIAAELRGIREALEGVIDPTASPSYPGVVRVRTEPSENA